MHPTTHSSQPEPSCLYRLASLPFLSHSPVSVPVDLASKVEHEVKHFNFLLNLETTDISDSSTSDHKMDENQEIKQTALAFIPNIDTIRYTFLTSLLLLNKHPVLIIGMVILKNY